MSQMSLEALASSAANAQQQQQRAATSPTTPPLSPSKETRVSDTVISDRDQSLPVTTPPPPPAVGSLPLPAPLPPLVGASPNGPTSSQEPTSPDGQHPRASAFGVEAVADRLASTYSTTSEEVFRRAAMYLAERESGGKRTYTPEALRDEVSSVYRHVITFIDEGRPGDPSVELAQRHKWEVVCQVLRRILMRGGVPQTVRLDEFLEPRKLRKRYLYSKQMNSTHKEDPDSPPVTPNPLPVVQPIAPSMVPQSTVENTEPMINVDGPEPQPATIPETTPKVDRKRKSSSSSLKTSPQRPRLVTWVNSSFICNKYSEQAKALAGEIAARHKVDNPELFSLATLYFKGRSTFNMNTPKLLRDEVVAVHRTVLADKWLLLLAKVTAFYQEREERLKRKWDLISLVLRQVLISGGVPESPNLDAFLDPDKLENRYNFTMFHVKKCADIDECEPPSKRARLSRNSTGSLTNEQASRLANGTPSLAEQAMICQNCSAEPAKVWCDVCKQLCQQCATEIHKFRVFKFHQLLPLADGHDGSTTIIESGVVNVLGQQDPTKPPPSQEQTSKNSIATIPNNTASTSTTSAPAQQNTGAP